LGGDPNFTVSKHPAYEQAKAQVDEAQRQVDHTVVRAPFNGIVTHVDQLQPGVYLVASTAALTNTGAVALVATDDIWIEANFKETVLTWVKPGDSVEISVDSYPDRSWTGKVKSIAPASGAEFSVLPAQNTSGNWVKVVQRIPVRIAVERKPSGPPLRSGMSAVLSLGLASLQLMLDRGSSRIGFTPRRSSPSSWWPVSASISSSSTCLRPTIPSVRRAFSGT
jgi:membrane fusion protein (multidrug efflux system)